MKLVGIAFFLAACCICTLGETESSNCTTNASSTTSIAAQVREAVSTSTSPVTTSKSQVSITTARQARNESSTISLTLSSVKTNTQQTIQDTKIQATTQAATTQPLVKTSLAAEDKSNSTANTAFQGNETQSTPNGTLGAPSTKGPSLPPTTALQKTAFAPETSSLPVNSTTEPTNFSSSGNKKLPEDTIHYSSVILPIVITLIVITLSVFSLVALYRMCQKKTPERQENGTEQAQSDKEGVKLLSVKTTSAETGEHSSQGKNKTRQRDDSSSHVSNKYM